MARGKGSQMDFTKIPDDVDVLHDNGVMKVGDIREMEAGFNGGPNELASTIVFWDDLIQFSALGLVAKIFEVEKMAELMEPGEMAWDYNLYFYRPGELTDTIDFVEWLFKETFAMPMGRERIEEIYCTHYGEILKMSPTSTMFISMIKMEPAYKDLTLVFRYPFMGIHKFVASLYDHFHTKPADLPIKFLSLNAYGLDEQRLLTEDQSVYDMIMVVNLGGVYMYIEDTEHRHLTIFAPNIHNGVPVDISVGFAAAFGKTDVGPCNSSINLFDEGIAIC